MESIIAKNEEHVLAGFNLVEAGWKIALEDSCETCGGFLLKHPRTEELRCCSLDCKIKTAADIANNIMSSDNIDENSVDDYNDSGSEWQVNLEDMPESFDELMREYEQKNSGRDQVSSRLGEKLLQGWVMLPEYCTSAGCVGVPLVTDSKNNGAAQVNTNTAAGGGGGGVSYGSSNSSRGGDGGCVLTCVCCDSEYIRNRDGSLKLITSSAKAPVYDAAVGYDVNQIPDLTVYNDDDSSWESNLLSKALLGGASLLAEICSNGNCSTPLIRDKQGVVKCVACGISFKNKVSLATNPQPSSSTTAATTASELTKQFVSNMLSEIKSAVVNEYSDTDDSDGNSYAASDSGDSMDSSKLFVNAIKRKSLAGYSGGVINSNSNNNIATNDNNLEISLPNKCSATSSDKDESFASFLEQRTKEKYEKRAAAVAAAVSRKTLVPLASKRLVSTRKASPSSEYLHAQAIGSLEQKISQSVDILSDENTSLNESISLAKLIKELTDALQSVRHMND